MRTSHIITLKALLAGGIFLALIAWAHTRVDWSELLAAWQQISIPAIFIICACVLISHVLRVARIHYAYSRKYPIPIADVCGVSLVHNTISFLLPMRLGEAALPILSKRRLDINLGYSTASLVLVRVFDAHVLLLLLIVFASQSYLGDRAKIIVWCLLLSTPVVLFVLVRWLRLSQRFLNIQILVKQSLTLVVLYVITLCIWLVKLTALVMLAIALGGLQFDHAWIAMILADASALSPITGFANAGTFEAAFMLPLLPLGYNGDALLQVALNVHILILLTNLLAGSVGALLLLFNNTSKQV